MRIICGTNPAAVIEPFPDGARVAFYGDSITRLGGGVMRVAAQYRELFPGRDVRFFNAGISGGGLPDAAFYFDGWIAPFKPTHVVLAFGVNDANTIAGGRLDDAAAEALRIDGALAEFRERYATLVGHVEALGAKAILRAITPFDNAVRTDDGAAPPNPVKAELFRRVADEIRALAANLGLPCIDDWARMSELLDSGEDDFMPDRIHPVEHGQWRLAENLLAAQGLPIAPFRPREETAEAAGLAEWDELSQRVANVLSAERTFVHDETLDVPSRMAKVRAWLDANENKLGVLPVLIQFARDYLRDKPREDELYAGVAALAPANRKHSGTRTAAIAAFALASATFAPIAAAEETVSFPTLPPPGIVDGDLADPCWAEAYRTPSFTSAKEGGEITETTCAYAFCGDSALYVAYRCEFADLAARERTVASSKGPFDCDCVETFIDAGDTGNYAHLAVNVAGDIYKTGITGDIKAAVQLHEKDWTVEIEIPYSSLKLSGQVFSKNWKMNFCRGNYGIKEISSWAKLGAGSFHDTAAFNAVTGIPADLVQLAKEQAAAARGDFDFRLDHLICSGQGKIRATLDLVTEKSLKGCAVRARILDGTNEVLSTTVRPVYFHNEAELPIGALPYGRYTFEIALVGPDGSVERSRSEDIWKVPPPMENPAKAKVEVRGQNIYVDGRFFFPVITWKLAANGDFATREEWEAANDTLCADMAAHGFNALIDGPSCLSDFPPEWFERTKSMPAWNKKQYETHRRLGVGLADFARIAARHGIFIIHHSPFLGKKNTGSAFSRQCFVEEMLKYREIPNILCWQTADETDGQVEENLLRNRLYHEIDPGRLTWLNVINAVSANKDAADILATDPYPIPNGKVATVATHADRLKQNTEGRPGVASWLWLQNFGGEGSWTRPPTPEEVRAMAMLALNHGVGGIAYFNYMEPKQRNGVRQHQEGWSMLKEFNAHLQEWAEPMLTGRRLFLGRRGDEDVLEFEFKGRKYRSSVNVETFECSIGAVE